MFAINRKEQLNEVHWQPEGEGLYFIQTETSQGGSNSTTGLQHGFIKEDKIEQWLSRKAPSTQAPEQQLRILCISKPKRHQSAQLAISRTTYCRIEEAFSLSDTTIGSLFNLSGVFSRFTEYDPVTRSPTYFRLVVKSKQKDNVGNWEVSLTYNISTGCTDAFICSEGIFAAANAGDPGQTNRTPIKRFVAHLKTVPSLWHHPLLLPTLLIRLFCERISIDRLGVAEKLVELEKEMGVTVAGRSKAERSLDNWPHDLDIKQITINLNSTGALILYLSQTCVWTQNCITFLSQLCSEFTDTASHKPSKDLWLSSMQLKDALAHESSALSAISLTMSTKSARIQSQLNVLYSASAQKESAIALNYSRMAQEQNEIAAREVALNTKIATSTKSDSIAMTTFTFITAVFLPGSYVAGLFDTGMFEWMGGSAGNDGDGGPGAQVAGRVSGLFWVYWVTTVPLTAVVLLGWWLWYRSADKQWQKDMGYRLDGSALAERSASADSRGGSGVGVVVREVKIA